SEIGLPRGTEASSLLLFNVGVEVGQLAVIGGLLLAGWLITRLRTEALPVVQMVGAYVIGTAGMYWAIERAVALWL
ncbi:MAG: HupE/UreJ family protein, partial [Pseudomonadota bacterium]